MPELPEKSGVGFASLAGVWCGQVKLAADFDDLPEALADALGASCDSNASDESDHTGPAGETESERARRILLAMSPPAGPEPDWEDQKREMLDKRNRKLEAP